MQPFSVALALTLTLACASTQADCPYRAELQAEVTITSRVAATLEASAVRASEFGPESGPLYLPGDKFTGTLLTVTVRKSWLYWPPSVTRSAGSTPTWKRGEIRTVFVSAPALTACPSNVPVEAEIATTSVCCDVLPYEQECLVPPAITLVEIRKMASQE